MEVGIPDRPRGSASDSLEGADEEASRAQRAEQSWVEAIGVRRRSGRRTEAPAEAVTETGSTGDKKDKASSRGERQAAAAFGRLVHELLANALDGAQLEGLEAAATVLGQRHGLSEEEAKRGSAGREEGPRSSSTPGRPHSRPRAP